jgi:hypothetical protein
VPLMNLGRCDEAGKDDHTGTATRIVTDITIESERIDVVTELS